MAHKVNEVLSGENAVKLVTTKQHPTSARKTVGTIPSRRKFTPAFKIKVLDSYRLDCHGNQRATARKHRIHRRQVQNWLRCEENLRSCYADCVNSGNNDSSELVVTQQLRNVVVKSEGSMDSIASVVTPASPALNISLARPHGDELAVQQEPPLPSHPQPPSHGSPSTADCGFHANLPLHPSASREEQYPHSGEYKDKIVIAKLQSYEKKRSDYCSEYYPVNTKEYALEGTSMFRNRSVVTPYQTLSTYHPSSDPRYGMSSDVGVTSSRIGTYSESARPQGTGSSCRSTCSFSYGTGYLPAHQNAADDLTRRRSFSLQFKLEVLDAFHHEEGVAGNQRATARKFGINRRQVQKWLGQEIKLRGNIDIASTHYATMSPESPLREAPLCSVMPKIQYASSSSPPEPISSTVPTPPAPAIPPTTSSFAKNDGIFFKPYLDNPICKPSEDSIFR